MRLNKRRPWMFLVVAASLLCVGFIWGQNPPTATPNPAPSQLASAAAAPLSPAIMIDAAHGGSESGAVLNPVILEKDINLAFARLLRQDLTARGILVRLVRESDVNLSSDDRAAIVNSAHPLLYLCLHASSQGGGVRIFSAMLPGSGQNNGLFVDWASAQSGALSASRSLEQKLADALQKAGIPARALIAPLRPLNNVMVPALAIEICPSGADVSQLAAADFQQKTAAGLSNALAAIMPAISPTAGAPR